MARNETVVRAPRDKVFEVFATGRRYADWVVGAKRVRIVEDDWPRPGSQFHHTVGVGPIKIRDTTKVVSVDPPRRIVLDARARPLGRAVVDLELEEADGGTRVIMKEELARAPELLKMAVDWMIRLRNVEALRRLRTICESPGT
jgi:uncharacterized protein YndB with AHSA1/START domain